MKYEYDRKREWSDDKSRADHYEYMCEKLEKEFGQHSVAEIFSLFMLSVLSVVAFLIYARATISFFSVLASILMVLIVFIVFVIVYKVTSSLFIEFILAANDSPLKRVLKVVGLILVITIVFIIYLTTRNID